MNEGLMLKVMGGSTVIKHPIRSGLDVVDMINAGLPAKAVRNIQVHIGASDTEMAKLIGVSPKTFRGRKIFKGDEGDHAYRIVKAIARAEEVIGSHAGAIRWLRSKQPALGNRIPLNLVSTSAGAEAVSDLLGRIEYGVYS